MPLLTLTVAQLFSIQSSWD